MKKFPLPPHKHASPLLDACHGKPVPFTPVWIMRQAGRYLPEYRELRRRVSFLELCRTPELATEATVTAARVLGVDAAILFSDILIPFPALGCPVRFEEGGPVMDKPVRTARDLKKLRAFDADHDLPFVPAAIRLIQRALGGSIPLLGFAGSPFTLACYLVEGRSHPQFPQTRKMLFSEPNLFHGLLSRLGDVVADFLVSQARAGVDAVQLFDTWGGLLARKDYEPFSLAPLRKIIRRLRRDCPGLPVILYVNNGAHLLEALGTAGADVVSVDWRTPLSEARRRLGRKIAVQGNLDPYALFLPPAQLKKRILAVLDDNAGKPGHVFNLGHGVLPDTPVEAVKLTIDIVHQYRLRKTS